MYAYELFFKYSNIFPGSWAATHTAAVEQRLSFSLVDVSGPRTTIELEASNVREVLDHLWEQDLREKNFYFPTGVSAYTHTYKLCTIDSC